MWSSHQMWSSHCKPCNQFIMSARFVFLSFVYSMDSSSVRHFGNILSIKTRSRFQTLKLTEWRQSIEWTNLIKRTSENVSRPKPAKSSRVEANHQEKHGVKLTENTLRPSITSPQNHRDEGVRKTIFGLFRRNGTKNETVLQFWARLGATT